MGNKAIERRFKFKLGVEDAEAWGLFFGLQLAVNLNVQKLEVESDSPILVQLVQMNDCGLHPLGSLISGCINFMASFNSTKISHIFREGYMTADVLAKDNINHDLGLLMLDDPLIHAAQMFLDDISAVF
ncbi:PREDICTED: putative ribonuclease H protein At1g65750-like [Fragaria vesca subsp. vesca]